MKFNYNWQLKNTIYTKNRGTVFSCFSGGGGSSMGYKLAGFDVIGINEIDKMMLNNYLENNEVKYVFDIPIQELINKKLPNKLYNLDILDGSPPCSTFSMAGPREKNWGKLKKFREGQSEQILDKLFFHFINLADKLKPKIVIAENVKGMIMGKAISYRSNYINDIHKHLDKIGYYSQHFLLNASKMGVPQKRERVFVIALRKDLAGPFLKQDGFFSKIPKLDLNFNEKPILFGTYRSEKGIEKDTDRAKLLQYRIITDRTINDINQRLYGKNSGFNSPIVHDNEICPTILANGLHWRFYDGLVFTNSDLILSGTFPTDYKFLNSLKYIIGMSVPPVMIAQIANRLYKQWLSKI